MNPKLITFVGIHNLSESLKKISMAEIRPFRAWRYNNFLTPVIGELTAPLFDVVSEQQRLKLYQNPHNSIHLSVPLVQNGGSTAGEIALATLNTWKKEGIISQDEKPAIYVYYQYFSLADQPALFCRKGFVCFLRVYDWQENVLLRHENTIPHAVNDRIELLEKTLLNASPTHGIYTDKAHLLEKYMDEAIKNPIYETEDYQGVRDVLGKIEDEKVIEFFINHLKDKQLILADGHHRYESSLVFKQAKEKENPAHTGEEGYNFHLIFLTNSEADDLKILPTHRLWKNAFGRFTTHDFIKKIGHYFVVNQVDNPFDLNEIISGKKWTYGLILRKDTESGNSNHDVIAFKITLKPASLPILDWDFPLVIKELDLTVLHYFVFQQVIGIEGKEQRNSEEIGYERNFTECLTQVLQGKAQAAFIVNPVKMDEVQKVCQSGYTLPQKSTYFYPKVISGFVFGDIS